MIKPLDPANIRVLQLHNRYQITGGEEGVVQAEQDLLKQNGHAVKLLEVTNDDITGPIAKLQTAIGAVYSTRAKRQVCEAIDAFRPSVVHVHNFFPLLSPSVYDACRQRGIPVVQTLHNYRLACPKAMFYRDGQICESCLEAGSPWPGVRHGCYRDSVAQTAVVATMLAAHNWRKTWQTRVDGFIALTQFQRQKMMLAGLPADRLYVKPNFLAAANLERRASDTPFFLSVGRLSEEKGIDLAIAAYIQNPDLPLLKIVGDGPARSALEAQVQQANLTEKIVFLGRQEKSQVLTLMCRAIGLIFPSVWYEGFPLTIVEAFGCGLPVIASNFGSMAEIVTDRATGLHFQARDPGDLAQKLAQLATQPDLHHQLSVEAQRIYQTCYTPEINYQQTIDIYQAVISHKKSQP
jgi:glycosyltransferase involved in cell wall biosynthesis